MAVDGLDPIGCFCNQRNGAVLFYLRKQRRGRPSKAKNTGVWRISPIPQALGQIRGDSQHQMEQGAADPCIGIIFCLQFPNPSLPGGAGIKKTLQAGAKLPGEPFKILV